ncbi:rhodanese-like domain-containing protein [Flavobacteriaceae bacterium]|jgi:rhodanese-related sulfurtransferase|nr:rhodanese-like domain-containing protein [Flavobacteriaceae bacterium]MBT4231535.1 rhodanese-like domain-containing protein [Flavobacteriaceae bacterium]MBT5392364.1 rhodanese-like domain-containing protein [Flavobacteriaceae bacterium]MBT7574501.1 rhodanese-like domain-containing protein [Flavobacteriaceae bacterium]MBT7984481.1 rhodanese-like domain-containing protein [Flavobacteriaceae bacterium]
MNKYFFLLFSLLVFSQENTQVYEVLSYDDFKNQINNDNVLLFDIRTMDEFNSGHLKGSINIDFYEEKLFDKFFKKVNKSKPIYIYCRSGNRSKKSSEKLKKLGFVKIFDLEGGYKNWIKKSN